MERNGYWQVNPVVVQHMKDCQDREAGKSALFSRSTSRVAPTLGLNKCSLHIPKGVDDLKKTALPPSRSTWRKVIVGQLC